MTDALGPFGARCLEGKTILITGAASGMGKAASILAGASGATVIVTGRQGYDEVAAAIREAGGKAEGHRLEVTDADNWATVVDAVMRDHGRIDGLANVAGVNTPQDSLLTQTIEGWDFHQNVNLKGPYLGLRLIVPHMLEAGGGRIVNVSSVCGMIGIPNTMAYSAAKAGLSGLARQIAVEYADRGLRINTISPGMVRTAIHLKTTQETLDRAEAAIPTKNMGEPIDIAGMIIYLLGPGSDFITGQDYAIDGGWTVSY